MSPQEQEPQQPPSFWDFVPGAQPNHPVPGQGVDHHDPPPPPPPPPPFFGAFPFRPFNQGPPRPPPAPPCGPPPGVYRGPWAADVDWADFSYSDGNDHGCRRGRHHGRHHRHCPDDSDEKENNNEKAAKEKADSPDTMDADAPDPEEVAPRDSEYPPPPYGPGHCRRGGRWHGSGRGGPWGRHHCHRRRGNQPPFDFPGMMRGFMNHPIFQSLRDQAERYRNNSDDDDDSSFAPPIDTFATESAYILHVALPGAKKEDVGVNWNPDTSTLRIAGVVHRPGDEAFLQGLVSTERRVGLFEREITLPPPDVAADAHEGVDGASITARMEDGVLVVTVPKVEREWTEIRKVDIL